MDLGKLFEGFTKAQISKRHNIYDRKKNVTGDLGNEISREGWCWC